MKPTRSLTYTFAACTLILSAFSGKAKQPEVSTNSQETQSTEKVGNYPEKLVHDFPNIYTDTAYCSDDYNVVVRAVWMSQRGRKTKVTSPDQLPAVSNYDFVRFTSFNSSRRSSTTDVKSSVLEIEHRSGQ